MANTSKTRGPNGIRNGRWWTRRTFHRRWHKQRRTCRRPQHSKRPQQSRPHLPLAQTQAMPQSRRMSHHRTPLEKAHIVHLRLAARLRAHHRPLRQRPKANRERYLPRRPIPVNAGGYSQQAPLSARGTSRWWNPYPSMSVEGGALKTSPSLENGDYTGWKASKGAKSTRKKTRSASSTTSAPESMLAKRCWWHSGSSRLPSYYNTTTSTSRRALPTPCRSRHSRSKKRRIVSTHYNCRRAQGGGKRAYLHPDGKPHTEGTVSSPLLSAVDSSMPMHRRLTTTQQPPPAALFGAAPVEARPEKEKQNSNMTHGPGTHSSECKSRVKSSPPSSRWETCRGPFAQQVPRDGFSQTMQPQATVTSPLPSYSVPQATTPTPSSSHWETCAGPPAQQAPRDDLSSTMQPQAIVTSPPPTLREPQAILHPAALERPSPQADFVVNDKSEPDGKSILHQLSVGQPFLSISFQLPLLVRPLVQTVLKRQNKSTT